MGDTLQVTPDIPPVIEDVINTTLASSNSTKFTPTTEGIACAYLSLMIMALVPIFVGSFKSIKHQVETQTNFRETGEQAETMTVKDAAIFPVIASGALLGFYLLMKFIPNLVNLVVPGYFFLLGVIAMFRLITPMIHRIFPKKFNSVQYTFLFGSNNLELSSSSSSNTSNDDRSGSDSPTDSSNSTENQLVPSNLMICSKFTPSDIVAFIIASILGFCYLWTKHWVLNNAFGLAFALNGIEILPINTVGVGTILLCGLFFYDIFWVFCTDVMVSVAKNFDAPIKIIFPQDFLVRGIWGKNFAMLGLGDIVIPGIFIAFLLRFDHSLKRGKNVYFWSCFLAYIFGLAMTIGVMSYFKHAQPALLYLVPCCILIPYGMAIVNGDLKALVNYRDHPLPSENDENEADDDEEEEDEEDERENDNDEDNDKTSKKRKLTSSSKNAISTRANSKKNK